MSIPLSKPSNSHHSTRGKSNKVLEFSRQLSQQPDLASQLALIIFTFENIFPCKALLWIDESISTHGKADCLTHLVTQSSPLSELMAKALQIRELVFDDKNRGEGDEKPGTIAFPILIQGDQIGAVQLERVDGSGFNRGERETISDLCFQASLQLGLNIQASKRRKQQEKLDMLGLVEQINKSISSNLDLDNLITSSLSQIHQRFEYSRISVYILFDELHQVYIKTGITGDGINLPERYIPLNKDEPVDWVISHQERIVINNPLGVSRFSIVNPAIKSELIIPLINGNTFLGVIEFCSDVLGAFDQNTVDILGSLTESMGIAIRNARLFSSEQLQRQLIEELSEVTSTVSAGSSIEEISNDLLMVLSRYIHYEIAAFWLLESNSDESGFEKFTSIPRLTSLYLAEESTNDHEEGQISIAELKDRLLEEEEKTGLFSNFSWLSEIIEGRVPQISSTSPDEPIGEILKLPEDHSALGIPMVVKDNELGIILLVHRSRYIFTDDSLIAAATFSKYSSVTIENTRLFTSVHEQMWMSTVLLQVAETYQSINSLDELVESATRMLTELLGANACALYLWDDIIESLSLQISYGFDDEQQLILKEWDILNNTSDLFSQLFIENTPVVLEENILSTDNGARLFPLYNSTKDLLIIFPVTKQDEIIGAIFIDFTGAKFTKESSQKAWDDMYAIIQGVCQQTAVAIARIKLAKAREEEAYISVALLQVAQAIVSLNQLADILSSIVRITPILVGVKRAIIYLWNKTDSVFEPSQYYGFTKSDLHFEGHAIKSSEFPFVEVIFRQNQMGYYQLPIDSSPSSWNEIEASQVNLIEGNITEADDQIGVKLNPDALQEKGRLLIGFPLSITGEVLGIMLIEEEDPIKGAPSYHIREKRIEIVRGISQQAALAIKNEQLQRDAVNSEKMERELQLAREIQQTFLPHHLPDIPGWDIDIRWQPARQVAGDFYDLIEISEGKLGLVIADVADKGMPAALFMTLIRTLIRAAAKENPSPAAVLQQVNELLFQDSKNGMFVTVFYAVIELSTGKIIYSNAGHNPPIVKYSDKENVIELTRTSMALGIFNEIEVQQREIYLNTGDWIFLYTDGVTEAFSITDEMYGVQRLFDLILSKHYESSVELLDSVHGSVNHFIEGVELSDDLTIAAIYKN